MVDSSLRHRTNGTMELVGLALPRNQRIAMGVACYLKRVHRYRIQTYCFQRFHAFQWHFAHVGPLAVDVDDGHY